MDKENELVDTIDYFGRRIEEEDFAIVPSIKIKDRFAVVINSKKDHAQVNLFESWKYEIRMKRPISYLVPRHAVAFTVDEVSTFLNMYRTWRENQ